MCSICLLENDIAEDSLVTVICNKRDCSLGGEAGAVFHQACIIDLVDSKSSSRRTFYLRKQSHFDLAGARSPPPPAAARDLR